MHSLLHLMQSVRKSGPLWATSTFPYESNMFNFKKYVNGPKGVQNQIIENHLRFMKYKNSITNAALNTDDSYQYYKNWFEYRRLTHCTEYKSDIIFPGQDILLNSIKNNAEQSLLRSEFNRCVFRGTVFHSTLYSRPQKTDDTVVQLKDNTIVQIVKFEYIQRRYCMKVRQLVVSSIGESVPMLHLMKVVGKKDPIITLIDEIKCKMIHIDVGECYVCALPNMIEIQ